MTSPSVNAPPSTVEDSLPVGGLGTESQGSHFEAAGDEHPDAPIGEGSAGDGELGGEGQLGCECPQAESQRHGRHGGKEGGEGGRDFFAGLGQECHITGRHTVPHIELNASCLFRCGPGVFGCGQHGASMLIAQLRRDCGQLFWEGKSGIEGNAGARGIR
jgi:hypothetical protein